MSHRHKNNCNADGAAGDVPTVYLSLEWCDWVMTLSLKANTNLQY
jgi:hypothetical protein